MLSYCWSAVIAELKCKCDLYYLPYFQWLKIMNIFYTRGNKMYRIRTYVDISLPYSGRTADMRCYQMFPSCHHVTSFASYSCWFVFIRYTYKLTLFSTIVKLQLKFRSYITLGIGRLCKVATTYFIKRWDLFIKKGTDLFRCCNTKIMCFVLLYFPVL